jgi:hypothetical protein
MTIRPPPRLPTWAGLVAVAAVLIGVTVAGLSSVSTMAIWPVDGRA